MKRYISENIPTYSEIIMGLPKETPETFRKGIGQLLKSGQHSSINMYACELLPNSIMGQNDFIKKYKIQTIKTPIARLYTSPNTWDIPEYDRYIIANDSITIDEWKECYLFSWIVQCFHCLGLTRYLSIYLWREQGLEYEKFYARLIEFFTQSPDTIGGTVLNKVKNIIDFAVQSSEHSFTYYNPLFGDLLWPLEEGGYLEILTKLNEFYEQMSVFMKNYKTDNSVVQDLIVYQNAVIRKLNCSVHSVELKYDWPSYFTIASDDVLRAQSRVVQVGDAEPFMNWADFAKYVVWYGRKNGATQYHVENMEVKKGSV